MIRLDEVLKQYSIVKVEYELNESDIDHGEDYEEMKQVILDALFLKYLGQDIRK